MRKQLLLLPTLLALAATSLIAQTTETFETETTGSTTFTDNGQGFIITNGSGETTYDVEFYSNGGWNGSSADSKFIDNSSGSPATGDGSRFTISTSGGTDVTIKSFYLYVSTRGLAAAATTLTITGKRNGGTEFTIVKNSGFNNPANTGTNNGFTFIDFSTEGGSNNSNTAIDELVFSTTGFADYLALDAFRWDNFSGPTWDGSTSTDWNVGSNWSTNSVPTNSDNVVIPSAPSSQPHVTLAPGTPAVCADLTVESGATLTIDAGKALTVSGTLANAGTVDIKATASGIGSLITNGTVSGAGSFKAEQYLTGSGGATPNGLFYYVSSPIPNATAANYNVAGGNKLWIDDEPNQTYPQLTFGAIPLEVGQGYIARMGSNTTVAFNGSSYNTGNITEGSLTRTGSTETNRGYNLVGNPYPSTVSWDDASRTNLETTMYYRTHNGSTMLFDTYNATGSVGTSNNGTTVSGDIPPGQGFWVRVPTDGQTGSVTFENADRSHGTAASIYKAAAEEGTLRLTLSDGAISDEQIILFNPSALDGYDAYDSQKFWANNVPQLYTNINEDTLTINGMNNPVTNATVPLGMKVPAQGAYTLNTTSITFTETPVYLEDTELNNFQNLNTTPTYAFNSNAGNIGDRFVLHFSEITGIDEVENAIQVYTSNSQLHVNLNQPSTGTVTVMDMSGRMIHQQNIYSDKKITDLKTSTGIYLVKVETADKTITRKVSIR